MLVKLFHGSYCYITKVYPKYFLLEESRAEEGPGLYFTPNLKEAKLFGDKISYIKVDKNFRRQWYPSRALIEDLNIDRKFLAFLKKLFLLDKESAYYLLTNYGEELEQVDDVVEFCKSDDLKRFYYDYYASMEIRNVLIELGLEFGADKLALVWTKDQFKQRLGLYNPKRMYFALINTNIKVYPYKEGM